MFQKRVLACSFAATMPHSAVANIIGNINNQQFEVTKIYANISRIGTGTRTNGIFVDIPGRIGMLSNALLSWTKTDRRQSDRLQWTRW